MSTTHLSSKGQVVIPKAIREAHAWKPGQRFTIRETPDGAIVLQPQGTFPTTTSDEVAGCLAYDGPPVSVEAMHGGVALARRFEEWDSSDDRD